MKNTQAEGPAAAVYVVMGVSGVGKTTIATAISEKHNFIFLEGDDFHPEANIKIMSSGQALNDKNRLPWLKSLASATALNRQKGTVCVTCSALKRKYRDEIRSYIPDAAFIHLQGNVDYIKKQMACREGHFMPLSLLRSQFETLESLKADELGVIIPIESGIDDVLAQVDSFLCAQQKLSKL